MAIKASDKLISAVRRYQAGDDSAFDIIYYESIQYITRCVLNVVNKTAADASDDAKQDIIQETYMTVAAKLHTLQNPEAFLQWAGQTATRLAERTWIRDSRRYQQEMPEEDLLYEPVDESFIPEDILQNREKQRIIRQILEELPTTQYLCIVEYFYNGLKEAQVAEKLGMPLNTVKTNLRRAKQKLKDAIETTEKTEGIRLHSMGWLLWLYFLQDMRNTVMDPKQQDALLGKIRAGMGAAAGAAGAGAAASAAGASAGAGAASSAAGASGSAAAAGFFSTLGGKITAAVLAVAISVGAVAGGIGAKEPDPNLPQATLYTAEELEELQHLLNYTMAAEFYKFEDSIQYPFDFNNWSEYESYLYFTCANNLVRLIVANEGDRYFPVEVTDTHFIYSWEASGMLSWELVNRGFNPDLSEVEDSPFLDILLNVEGDQVYQTRTDPIEVGELILNSIEQVTSEHIRVNATYIPTQDGLVSGDALDCVFYCEKDRMEFYCEAEYHPPRWAFQLVSCGLAEEQPALGSVAPTYQPKDITSTVVNKNPYVTLTIVAQYSDGTPADYKVSVGDTVQGDVYFESEHTLEVQLVEGKYNIYYSKIYEPLNECAGRPFNVSSYIHSDSFAEEHLLTPIDRDGYHGSFDIYLPAGEDVTITIEVPNLEALAESLKQQAQSGQDSDGELPTEQTEAEETDPTETADREQDNIPDPIYFSPADVEMLEKLIGALAFPYAQDGPGPWSSCILDNQPVGYWDAEIAWRTLITAAMDSGLIDCESTGKKTYAVSRDEAYRFILDFFGFVPESADYPYVTDGDPLILDASLEAYRQARIFNLQHWGEDFIRVYAFLGKNDEYCKVVMLRRNPDSAFGWNVVTCDTYYSDDLPSEFVTTPINTSNGLYSVGGGHWISQEPETQAALQTPDNSADTGDGDFIGMYDAVMPEADAAQYAAGYWGLSVGYYGNGYDNPEGLSIVCDGISAGYYIFRLTAKDPTTGEISTLDTIMVDYTHGGTQSP